MLAQLLPVVTERVERLPENSAFLSDLDSLVDLVHLPSTPKRACHLNSPVVVSDGEGTVVLQQQPGHDVLQHLVVHHGGWVVVCLAVREGPEPVERLRQRQRRPECGLNDQRRPVYRFAAGKRPHASLP